ncbi:regulatory LuxR family protein [Streptomyces sp. 3211.6]|uniref:helix-turn-helix domain-containing protein n=1 Tax=Streptomyces sp. 3211.6 TaxID=1938845 RepID=UPI000EB4E500|nr:helix-turn-helix transcriptional regulator [Streptomyces sp. 3211.6]RKT08214.1 regulatory LuxR family protein [Streptomyces sp. 3211.6]
MTITPQLSEAELRVAQYIPYGWSNSRIALELHLGENTIATHVRRIRRRFGVVGVSRAVLADVLLTAGGVQPPTSFWRIPAPQLTFAELLLLGAIARHTRVRDIAHAAGIPRADVHGNVTALTRRSRAVDPVHLVGLSHGWQLLPLTLAGPPGPPAQAPDRTGSSKAIPASNVGSSA